MDESEPCGVVALQNDEPTDLLSNSINASSNSNNNKSKQIKFKNNPSANKKFHRFFGSHEQVLNIFSCALLRNKSHFLLQGSLYITKRSYGFHSNIFGFRNVLHGKWSDVTALKKENIALLFPTAISFVTKNNGKFLLASFLSRNFAYKHLCKLWHAQNPYCDMIAMADNASFDSNAKEAGEKLDFKSEAMPNVENNENFQYAAFDTSSASPTTDSSRSHSESFTSKSKMSDEPKNELHSQSANESALTPVSVPSNETLHGQTALLRKSPSSQKGQLSADDESSRKSKHRNQKSLTPHHTPNHHQKNASLSSCVSSSSSSYSNSSLSATFSFNRFVARVFDVLMSKNFLMLLILATILFTLYIYVFIIFFHVNQIEKKLSDLYNRLID